MIACKIANHVSRYIMGKKADTITAIFEACQRRGNWQFDNKFVKNMAEKHGFGNPFDATKLDHTSKFPPILLKNDRFIVHLGKGKHEFVKGIRHGFHTLEKIPDNNKEQWGYRPSILNEFNTSESNILSLVYNQRIINKFLYDDVQINPKIYGGHRTQANFSYLIGDHPITADRVQMEIDMTLEYDGEVTILEGKNGFHEDFATYQIYFPFLLYHNLKTRERLEIKKSIAVTYCERKKTTEPS